MKKREKLMALALVGAMVLSLAACGPKEAGTTPSADPTQETTPTPEAGMTAGEYKTTCHGYYGDFELTVTVSEDAITDITYGEHTETVGVGALAIDMMIERMLAANTSGVDTVTGATMTSFAVRSAVADCLKQAGAPAALTASAPPA